MVSVKEINTDVLIIGDGGAGLRASIEAAKQGVKVLVISKPKGDEPTTTSIIGGWITYRTRDEIDEFFETVLDEGNYLNDQDLVWVFANEVVERIPELQKFGVKMKVEVRQEEKIGVIRPIWRIIGPSGRVGEGIRQPLMKVARELGVNFMRNTMAIKLLKSDENRVVGALALDFENKRILEIKSKATILACGGASSVFLRNDNPSGVTGDGYALAYDVGAELVDMEFEIFSISPKQFCQIFSDNLDEKKVLFGTARAHYTCGGVKIDIWGRTKVKGLYAAGEVTGGLFGSARLGGTAMADIVVFGYRAGLQVAKEVKSIEKIKEPEIDTAVEEVSKLLERKGKDPTSIKREIQEIMWFNVGPIREEKRLQDALKRLNELEEKINEVYAKDFNLLRDVYEAKFMLKVAKMMTTSALIRKESRGSHWRIDYPKPSLDWLKNIYIKQENGKMKTEIRPVELKRAKPKGPFKIGERHTLCYIIMWL